MANADKPVQLDFKRDPSYKAGSTPIVVTVPRMVFLMIDGAGAPDAAPEGSAEFHEAIEALYTIKFWDKKHPRPAGYVKFSAAPLEGLWWMKGGTAFSEARPEDWRWTMMVRVPEFVDGRLFAQVIEACAHRKPGASERLAQMRLEEFTEGECVQILHVGPYDQEQPTIERMHAFARAHGYQPEGKHHEIYLGDPRRSAPEKLRTILRQPVVRC